jgi:hypothetical protein
MVRGGAFASNGGVVSPEKFTASRIYPFFCDFSQGRGFVPSEQVFVVRLEGV